jgi:Mg2+-importing ATPase
LKGYVAFLDPPKPTAATAIEALHKHGVVVKILTGDNDLISRKVCRDVGLLADPMLLGDEVEKMSDTELAEAAEKTTLFARLSPAHKQRIVRVLRSKGHVVGFMGDGINDSPALRAADIGISVDTAADIAKESADLILLQKDLMVLEGGVIEGRKVFANIIKYIRMGASSNFGNMFSVVGGSYFLPFLPMAPIQVLLNNLLYDASQVGIPSDHVDEEYLKTPRKWDIANIQRFMIFIGPMSSIFDYATYFLMLYFFNCKLFSASATSPEMKTYYEQLFHTGWFVESILTQTLIVHIIRTRRIPFLQSIASPFLLLTTLLVMAAGAALPYSPFANYFGFVPLPASYWAWIAGFLVCYSVLTHWVKVWFHKKYGID